MTTIISVGWKTGSRGVTVGNGEQGVGSECQLFFLRHLIKRYFNDVFGEFLLCLKI